jgi:hypothetical protein
MGMPHVPIPIPEEIQLLMYDYLNNNKKKKERKKEENSLFCNIESLKI